MPDFSLFTASDTLLIVMIAMAPGLIVGLVTGTLCWKERRVIGGLVGMVSGGLIFILGWLTYFVWLK